MIKNNSDSAPAHRECFLNSSNSENVSKRYKIIVAYDGTDYFGWQEQQFCVSVAKTLQDTFARVFNREIKIHGASRTDAGVHALGQVASFTVDLDIEPEIMLHAWSNVLTPSIVIKSLEVVPNDYNVYANVLNKTYWYHFSLERPLPFNTRFAWHFRYNVDIEKLQKCLEVFVGTHDFRSFSTGDDRGTDTIRSIDKVSVEYAPDYQAYRISITGPKFLKYMVRRVVGACIEVASRKHLDVEVLKKVLEAKNPEHTLPNAPAKGLVLYKIEYGDLD